MIIDKGLRAITYKITLDDSKITALERTNDYLKRKVGTLKTTVSNMKKAHDKLVEMMNEHVVEHKNTNAKINILFANKYGDQELLEMIVTQYPDGGGGGGGC